MGFIIAIDSIAKHGLLSLDTQKCFDTRKENSETRSEAECFYYLS